jgi:hypothetical protein
MTMNLIDLFQLHKGLFVSPSISWQYHSITEINACQNEYPLAYQQIQKVGFMYL